MKKINDKPLNKSTARNIEQYAKDYTHADNDFESVMVHFRRQKVL